MLPHTEEYWEHSGASKMELFAEIEKGFHPLTTFVNAPLACSISNGI